MKSPFLKKALPHIIAILVFLIVSIVYCKPAINGLVLHQQDVVGYKGMAHQSEEYKAKHGHFPLWTESTFSGMPTYNIALDATMKFLPNRVHSLLMLGLPKPISYFFLACLTFYFLALVMGVNPWIATLSAIGYAWSTYDPIIIVVGHETKMMALDLAPALIAGLVLLLRGNYIWGALIVAFFTSIMANTQHLQVVYYTLISAGVLTLCYAIQSWKTGKLKTTLIGAGIAAVASVIGFATMSVLLMPVKDVASETMRGGKTEMIKVDANGKTPKKGLDIDYAFMWSYGIPETFTLAVPRAAGGGSDGKEIGEDSKFAEKLTETLAFPQDQALQYANYALYWGAQEQGTAGPVYLGAVIVFLSILSLVFVKGWAKWWLVAISVIGIVMAWGKNFPLVNNFLFEHLPFYNNFRAPTLSLILPQFAFPLLAGLGLQQIIGATETREAIWKKFKTGLYATGALLVVMVGYYFTASYNAPNDAQLKQGMGQRGAQVLAQGRQPSPEMQQQGLELGKEAINAIRADRQSAFGADLIRTIVLIVLAAALVGFYVKGKYNQQQILLGGLIVLSSFDLLSVGMRYLTEDRYVEEADNEAALQPTQADLQISQDTEKGFRVFDQTGAPFESSTESARTSYNHNSVGGYSPAKLGLYQDLLDNQLRKGNPRVYNMLNTKYIITEDPQTRQPVAHRNPDAYGAAWLVKAVHYVQNGNDEMKALDSLNTRDTVIIDSSKLPAQYKDPAKFAPTPDSTASINLIDNDLDKVSYKFSAKTSQFAVFSEIYYPKGWKAFIDGKETDYFRVDYALRGMPVPAGDHTIEFKFEPQSYIMGDRITTWTSILLWLGLLGAIVYEWRKRSGKAKA